MAENQGSLQEQALGSVLGEVARVARPDVPIMYRDVAFDVEAIQAGWPDFETRFDSRRGRRMMAVVYPEDAVYRLATTMRDDDDPDARSGDGCAARGRVPAAAAGRRAASGVPRHRSGLRRAALHGRARPVPAVDRDLRRARRGRVSAAGAGRRQLTVGSG